MPLMVPKSASGSISLTEGQLKAIFKESDKDRDGKLTKEEIRKAFQKLGSRLPNWRVNRALRHADSDGDGHITEKELDDLVKYAAKLEYCLN